MFKSNISGTLRRSGNKQVFLFLLPGHSLGRRLRKIKPVRYVNPDYLIGTSGFLIFLNDAKRYYVFIVVDDITKDIRLTPEFSNYIFLILT